MSKNALKNKKKREKKKAAEAAASGANNAWLNKSLWCENWMEITVLRFSDGNKDSL